MSAQQELTPRQKAIQGAYYILKAYVDQYAGNDTGINNVMIDLCYLYADQIPDPNRNFVPPPPPPPED